VLKGEHPSVERDPTRCLLGKILSRPEFVRFFSGIEVPHARLHALVDKWESVLRENPGPKERSEWIENNLNPLLVKVFEKLKKVA